MSRRMTQLLSASHLFKMLSLSLSLTISLFLSLSSFLSRSHSTSFFKNLFSLPSCFCCSATCWSLFDLHLKCFTFLISLSLSVSLSLTLSSISASLSHPISSFFNCSLTLTCLFLNLLLAPTTISHSLFQFCPIQPFVLSIFYRIPSHPLSLSLVL